MISLVARGELVVSCACSSFLFLSFSMDPRFVSFDLLPSFPCLIVLLGESSCLGGFDQSRIECSSVLQLCLLRRRYISDIKSGLLESSGKIGHDSVNLTSGLGSDGLVASSQPETVSSVPEIAEFA